tara:strand:- start:217 stop:477 length:261 start_codon:yes stop_codon:yes gene_type:complete
MNLKKISSERATRVNAFELIGWLGALLVVFGYYLNANHLLSSWPVWVAGNLGVGLYSYHKSAYSTMVMSLIITVMNIYGYLSWLDN